MAHTKTPDAQPCFSKGDLEILVVDDDKVITLLHKGMLRHNSVNKKVEVFGNGSTAMKYLLKNRGSGKNYLVLLDLNMPIMDGWQFLERLQQCCIPNVHVAVVTSSILDQDLKKAWGFQKVVGYQQKPLTKGKFQSIAAHEKVRAFFTDQA